MKIYDGWGSNMYGLSALAVFIVMGISLTMGLIYLLVLWSIKKKRQQPFHPMVYLLPLATLIIGTLVLIERIL